MKHYLLLLSFLLSLTVVSSQSSGIDYENASLFLRNSWTSLFPFSSIEYVINPKDLLQPLDVIKRNVGVEGREEREGREGGLPLTPSSTLSMNPTLTSPSLKHDFLKDTSSSIPPSPKLSHTDVLLQEFTRGRKLEQQKLQQTQPLKPSHGDEIDDKSLNNSPGNQNSAVSTTSSHISSNWFSFSWPWSHNSWAKKNTTQETTSRDQKEKSAKREKNEKKNTDQISLLTTSNFQNLKVPLRWVPLGHHLSLSDAFSCAFDVLSFTIEATEPIQVFYSEFPNLQPTLDDVFALQRARCGSLLYPFFYSSTLECQIRVPRCGYFFPLGGASIAVLPDKFVNDYFDASSRFDSYAKD